MQLRIVGWGTDGRPCEITRGCKNASSLYVTKNDGYDMIAACSSCVPNGTPDGVGDIFMKIMKDAPNETSA
jgi:hypothetical protein